MWCFELCVFPRFYIWEILHSTIRKMNKHVLKIHKELEETKARLARQHKRVSNLFVNFKPSYISLHADVQTHSWFWEGLIMYDCSGSMSAEVWSAVALRHQKSDACSWS